MGRSRKFIFAIVVEEVKVSVLTVPNDFADKGSDCGTLLLDSVTVNAFAHA